MKPKPTEGDRLRTWRERRNLTQRDLAKRSTVSQQMLSALERGEHVSMRAHWHPNYAGEGWV